MWFNIIVKFNENAFYFILFFGETVENVIKTKPSWLYFFPQEISRGEKEKVGSS